MKTILKYLLAAPLAAIAAGSSTYAAPAIEISSRVMQEQQRVQVDIDDLPEKVKSSVGHDTELAWRILKAYLVTNPDKSTYYDLYVQKPDGETWMKVDKDGKVLN
ncbi:MAG TPA: hypothetical protein VGN64_01735 [Dyadobacter sp.]|jgi:hypothetical protein|nr:hypothetical protein [Dyadobacter sp.]